MTLNPHTIVEKIASAPDRPPSEVADAATRGVGAPAPTNAGRRPRVAHSQICDVLQEMRRQHVDGDSWLTFEQLVDRCANGDRELYAATAEEFSRRLRDRWHWTPEQISDVTCDADTLAEALHLVTRCEGDHDIEAAPGSTLCEGCQEVDEDRSHYEREEELFA